MTSPYALRATTEFDNCLTELLVAPLLQKVSSTLEHLMIETGGTGHFGDE